MELLLQLINGLQIGSIYALVALGYTMVYGIVKLINFAHGDIIMVGSYIAFSSVPLLLSFGLPPWACILPAVLLCALLGVLIDMVAYKPLRSSPKISTLFVSIGIVVAVVLQSLSLPFFIYLIPVGLAILLSFTLGKKIHLERSTVPPPISALITAIGVSIFLQNLCQLLYSANSQPFPTVIKLGSIPLGDFQVDGLIILTIVLSLVLMLLLQLFVKKTKAGTAMRAVSEDKGAAQLVGINVNATISITFAIGSALAAVAAILYSSSYPTIRPTMGSMLGIKAFIAAVLGGIGNIPGAMVGGFIIGLVESLTKAYISSSMADAIVYLILILVLLIKPAGLFGKNIGEKV